jgi:hypothetical protein
MKKKSSTFGIYNCPNCNAKIDIKKNYRELAKNDVINNDYDFKRYTKDVILLTNTRTKLINSKFAIVEFDWLSYNEIAYKEFLELTRNENEVKDKDDKESESLKQKIARRKKEILIETINNYPDKYSFPEQFKIVDMKNINDFIKWKRDLVVQNDPSIQVLTLIIEGRLYALDHYMKEKKINIYGWLRKVKGAGLLLSARLLSTLETIERFELPSKLWSYCGVGDPDPEHNRRENGQKTYKVEMKAIIWQLNTSFVRMNSQYRAIYDKRKKITDNTHPEWTKKHKDNDARRIMGKRFLQELYDSWYLALGKEPPAQPYGCEIEGHHRERNIVPYYEGPEKEPLNKRFKLNNEDLSNEIIDYEIIEV